MPLITEPGAYADIPAEDYHGNPDLLPGPSLSSSGAKTLLTKSPYHFWHSSALNPNREEEDKPHFALGRAAHDLILLSDRWPEFYHILPEGFSRAKTKQFADAIAEADAAEESGMTVLRYEDSLKVLAVGPHNTAAIDLALTLAEITVAAWGTHGTHQGLDQAVRRRCAAAGAKLHALKLTKDGLPAHPLYLASKLRPAPWDYDW